MLVDKRQRHITLIELLLVLLILAIATAVIGIQSHKALNEQKFLSEVMRVTDHIQLAQNLMSTMQTEIKLYFAVDVERGGINYWLHIEKPLEKWEKNMTQTHHLQAIKLIEFNTQKVEKGNNLLLLFTADGFVMPKGDFTLASALDNGMKRVIKLPGYPAPIQSNPFKENAISPKEPISEKEESVRLYPTDL
jgi:type II secretory pathway pseudopilin PulG